MVTKREKEVWFWVTENDKKRGSREAEGESGREVESASGKV